MKVESQFLTHPRPTGTTEKDYIHDWPIPNELMRYLKASAKRGRFTWVDIAQLIGEVHCQAYAAGSRATQRHLRYFLGMIEE